jgi:hypothetical protein
MAVAGPQPLIQDVEIRVTGAREGAADTARLNTAMDGTGKSAKAADAGLKQAEASTKRATAAAREQQGVLARGQAAWGTLTGSLGKVGAAAGALTFASQGLTTLLGGGMVGALGGAVVAVVQLGQQMFGAAETTKAWTEETVKAKTGIEDLTPALDAYARRLGQANAKGLTLLETQRALAQIANGGGVVNSQSVRARLGKIDEDLRRGPSVASVFGGQSDAERIRGLIEERARLQRLEEQALVREGVRADTGNVVRDDLEAEDRARRAKPSAGGGRGAPRPVGSYNPAWLGGAVDAARGLGGRMQDAAAQQMAELAREERLEQERARLVSEGVDARIAARRIEVERTRELAAEQAASLGPLADANGLAMSSMSSAATAMANVFGQAMANVIISGEAGAAGLKKAAGNALAGLSAQAFGYATMLGGLAAAAAFTGPILGLAAPGLLAGAAVMAGVGTALGLGARVLGAGESAGAPKAAAGGGGGAAGRAATPTVPASMGGGGGATVYNISLAGAVVGRGAEEEIHQMAYRAERRAGYTRGAQRIASAGGR